MTSRVTTLTLICDVKNNNPSLLPTTTFKVKRCDLLITSHYLRLFHDWEIGPYIIIFACSELEEERFSGIGRTWCWKYLSNNAILLPMILKPRLSSNLKTKTFFSSWCYKTIKSSFPKINKLKKDVHDVRTYTKMLKQCYFKQKNCLFLLKWPILAVSAKREF